MNTHKYKKNENTKQKYTGGISGKGQLKTQFVWRYDGYKTEGPEWKNKNSIFQTLKYLSL